LTAAFTGSGYVNSILGFSHGFDLYVNDDGQEDLEDKTDRIFMKGLDWIQEVSRKANFFLFLHTYEAHQPHLHRYFIKDKFMGGRLSNHKNMTRFPFDFVPTSEEKEFAVNLYDSSLFHLDQYLGILMDKLERMKLLSNTLIIILSDHGEDIWDHKTFGHGEMYKEVLHVPLIFYNFLGTRGGTVIENLVSLLDLYPTLAEVHDLKLAKKSMFDGIDLSYLLQEQKPLNREKIFSECLRSLYAKFTQYHDISVMDGHYHYIQGLDRRYSSAFLEEFFSVKDDIFEKYDLSESFSRGAEDYRRACRKLFLNIFRSNDPIPCAESAPYSKIEELELAEKLKSLGYL
jgi:arylsulfatase A-like enzyme